MPPFNKRAVTELLTTFSRTEVREFKKYVAYKGKQRVVELWNALQPSHPKYDLTDKELYDKVRPSQAYNDKVYRVWVSDLTRLAKEFVTIQGVHDDPFLFNTTLSKILMKRRVVKMGKKVLDQNQRLLGNVAKRDMHFYTHCFQHEDIAYQRMVLLQYLNQSDTLQKAMDFLDYSYLTQKLKYLVTMYNRQRIVKESYLLRLEEQLLAFLDKHPQTDKPLIHLYYLMLRMLHDLGDHASFDRYIAYYKAHREAIAPSEDRQLTSSAINFCYWNIQEGHLKFLTPRLELAKTMVEEGFILVDGHIPSYRFRNSVRIGIEAGDLSWVAFFIERWLPKTLKAHRPNLEAYNRAYLHFARQQYEAQKPWMLIMERKKRIKEENKKEDKEEGFSFIDLNHEIAFRILKLKTHYEQLGLQPTDLANRAFFAELEAYRNYLGRKSNMLESDRLAARNFYKALHQLHQKKQGKKLKVGDLRSYILNLQPTRELPWLLEKEREL